MKVTEIKVQSGPCSFLLISVEETPILTQPEDYWTMETFINDVHYLPQINTTYHYQSHINKPLMIMEHYIHSVLVTWGGIVLKPPQQLVNTEPLLLREHRVRFLWASGHNIFVSQWRQSPVLCMFLFKDTLLVYIVDSLTISSQPTAL